MENNHDSYRKSANNYTNNFDKEKQQNDFSNDSKNYQNNFDNATRDNLDHYANREDRNNSKFMNEEHSRNYQDGESNSEEFVSPRFSEDEFNSSNTSNQFKYEGKHEDFKKNRQSSPAYSIERTSASHNYDEDQSFDQRSAGIDADEKDGQFENRQSGRKGEIAEGLELDRSTKSTEDFKNRKSTKDKKNDENNKESLKEKISNASIKQIFVIIMVAILFFLAVWGLFDIINTIRNSGNPMLLPETATQHLVNSISENDYEEFKKLTESMNNVDNPQSLYDKLKKSLETSKDNLITNFVMIKLENGEQYLCSLYYDEDIDEYVFRSIVEIPAESQGFFAR